MCKICCNTTRVSSELTPPNWRTILSSRCFFPPFSPFPHGPVSTVFTRCFCVLCALLLCLHSVLLCPYCPSYALFTPCCFVPSALVACVSLHKILSLLPLVRTVHVMLFRPFCPCSGCSTPVFFCPSCPWHSLYSPYMESAVTSYLLPLSLCLHSMQLCRYWPYKLYHMWPP